MHTCTTINIYIQFTNIHFYRVVNCTFRGTAVSVFSSQSIHLLPPDTPENKHS